MGAELYMEKGTNQSRGLPKALPSAWCLVMEPQRLCEVFASITIPSG